MSKEILNTETNPNNIKEDDFCLVIGGAHKGKEGKAGDFNISKTGHLTITITQTDGVRFKTLGKNVQKKS